MTEREGETVEPATAATVADRPPRRADPMPQPAVARLGHFQLLDALGHGGMGTVYSAYDLRLDRKVAIKVLAKDDDSDRDHQRNQRLLREAQAMAKLSHPNVVPVYEVGVDRGAVFIAMEYVSGLTLGKWLKDTPRTWREIVGVFVQAARGLAAAHNAGIVHRDFKPANVLVDDRGRVRVVDFGIAQVLGVEDPLESPLTPRTIDFGVGDELTPPTPSTPLTEQGSLVGTPAYMSPEQYSSATVDARSDQWSFCVALYEALFGKRPFQGRGKTLADNVRRGAIVKPDAKSAVPGRVETVVLRGLATDPDRRFPSMTELADALSRDPGRRRRWIAVGALAAVAIAGIAALAGTRFGNRGETACTGAGAQLVGAWDDTVRAAVERSFAATRVAYADSSAKRTTAVLERYRDGWIAMRTDACRATRVRGEQSEHVLDLRMACLDAKRDELRALTTLLTGAVDAKIVEHAIDAASSLAPLAACADVTALLQPDAAPADPAARAKRSELRSRLDRLLAERRVGRVKDVLAPARALVADARVTADPHLLAEAIELQGELETRAGDLKAAEVTLGDALRRARQLGDADLFARAVIDLVDALGEGGISTSREALGVVRVAEAVVGDTHDPALPIRLQFEKADEYMTLARPELATPILAKALADGRRALGDDHVLLFEVEALYASSLSHTSKHAEARATYDALLVRAERVLGAQHPTTVLGRVQRCRIIADGDAVAEAVPCFAKELPVAQSVVGGNNRVLLSFRGYYGLMLMESGKPDEARAVYAAAFADVPADAWTDQWFVAFDIARTLGALENEVGDYQAALGHCEKAATSTENAKHAGPVGATCVGVALLGLGQADHALAVLEPIEARVRNADPMQLGAEPAQIGAWRFAYARAVWAARHDARKARVLAIEARGELGNGPKRTQLEQWLAKLPAR